jgi:hypothetical protein
MRHVVWHNQKDQIPKCHNGQKKSGLKAVISLENTQIRRYALEPAGTFILSDAGHCFQMVSVIGHGIGGKHIPAKMAQLTESQLLE